MSALIEELNEQFGLDGQVRFEAGPGDVPIAQIDNGHGKARVCLLGAQVLNWQPQGQQEVLWTSAAAVYEAGQSIRGGIPVCWPWFGEDAEGGNKPKHGFVRSEIWQVAATAVVQETQTQIKLGFCDNQGTRLLWPNTFELRMNITVGPNLKVELKACNTSDQSFTYGGALHSYFVVSDVEKIKIHGLEGVSYLDKLDGCKAKNQDGPITIAAETDRIYTDTTGECMIEDPGLGRKIHVAKRGSKSTVVWNPWAKKAQDLPDMADEAYRQMVCVETANAGEDKVTVPAFGSRTLRTVISVENSA